MDNQTTQLDTLGNNAPIMEVFPISNGFLLRTLPKTGRYPTLTYAMDVVGIAEEIIATQARLKLCLPSEQLELNLNQKTRTKK